MNWALIDADNITLDMCAASQEWITEHSRELLDGKRYVNAHSDVARKGAGIGFTYDEETTWFIPVCAEPDWYFDRDLWIWVNPNPPEPDEESGEPEPESEPDTE